MIDDGVPSRGHYKNIMNPSFTSLGTCSSTHKTYRHETVLDYSGGMTDPKTPLTPNYVCNGSSSTSAAGATTTITTTTTKPAAGAPAAGTTPAAGATPADKPEPVAGSKEANARELANQFFDQCDADKNGRITGREYWDCIRKIR